MRQADIGKSGAFEEPKGSSVNRQCMEATKKCSKEDKNSILLTNRNKTKNSTISLCDCNFDTDVLVAFTAAIMFWMNSVPIKSEEIAAINID